MTFGTRRHGRQRGRGERQRGVEGLRLVLGEVVDGGVVALCQHGATERGAACEQVDPCDRVAVVGVARRHPLEQCIEVGQPLRVDEAAAGLDRQQPQRDLGDDAGQAHTADRRPPQVGLGVGGDRPRSTVGGDDRQVDQMVAERSVAMVVLAMDVAGHGAADGDEAGPRGHGHEEAAGDDVAHQLVEADAGADTDDARLAVEVDPTGCQADDGAAGVLGGVTVGAAEPTGDQPTGPRQRRRSRGRQLRGVEVDDDGAGRRGPPPSRDQLFLAPHRRSRPYDAV
jgi:hypothetical protein